MNVSSGKKFKQALLQFKTTANDKKRKRDDDNSLDEVKCRKVSREIIDLTNDSDKKSLNENDLANGNHEITEDAPTKGLPLIDLTETMDVDCEIISCSCIKNDESPSSMKNSLTSPENQKNRESSVVLHSDKTDTSSFNSPAIVKNSVEKNITVPKKLTPKQLLKEQEAQLRKEERERLKQEKEKKILEAKEEKEKERLAKLEAKNEEKRLKEEERKAKEEEKKAKEEEKRQKEEERKAKEEERKVKEEEKRQKEELEKKRAALFTNFFLKGKKAPLKAQTTESSEKLICAKFIPFEIKDNMRMASIHRVPMTQEKLHHLDEFLLHPKYSDINELYLSRLRSSNYVRGHSENTWPSNANDDDDEDCKEIEIAPRYRCKLLQFHDNRRPAYWGTWRKRSKQINGRRPFKLDAEYFEYDVDSDDEWVDEEPGESLGGSDDDIESEDDYEVDNEVFVPHGYLSDEEGQLDEEISTNSPKSHKLNLNILEKQFEAEMKEKTSKLKSRVYGCLWIPNSVEKCGSNDVENLLISLRAVWNYERAPFHVTVDSVCSTPVVTPSSKSKTTPPLIPKGVLTEVPDSMMPDLIKLVHGNKLKGQKLTDEFRLHAWNIDAALNFTKTCIMNKVREIASWIPNLACWVVNDDVRQKYNLLDLSYTENTWKYTKTSEVATAKKVQTVVAEKLPPIPPPLVTTPTSSGSQKKAASITKFIRVIRASEREKQLAEASVSSTETALETAARSSELLTESHEVSNHLSGPSAQSSETSVHESETVAESVTTNESNQTTEPSADQITEAGK